MGIELQGHSGAIPLHAFAEPEFESMPSNIGRGVGLGRYSNYKMVNRRR